jgi:hypothetical protein
MFKKTIFFLLCLVLLAVPLFGAELLYFTDPAFEDLGGKTQPNSLFSHDLHAETYQVSCDTCHHVYENGKNVWQEGDPVQLCSDCHGGSKAELVNAYHMNCWGCHKRIKQDYSAADAPTSNCAKCHIPRDKLEEEKQNILEKAENKNKKLMRVINKLKTKAFY